MKYSVIQMAIGKDTAERRSRVTKEKMQVSTEQFPFFSGRFWVFGTLHSLVLSEVKHTIWYAGVSIS